MARETAERDGGREAEQPDFKWAVEYLVRERGQRRVAKMLGVDRKTVVRALRRKRLTARMNHAVRTFMATTDDPLVQEGMPLDRMESQIRFLLESMDDLDELVEKLTMRVEALEKVQARMEAEADDGRADVDDVPDVEEKGDEPAEELATGPERQHSERRPGWWRR